MGPRLVPLLGLVACFSPQVAPGLPCAPAEPRCPDGLVCVAQDGDETCELGASPDAPVVVDGPPDLPDARIDGSSVLDTDGDGIDDALDNCPIVDNVDQANEDGDAEGDACDPCPPYVDNTDDDGDGVGGPCDPDPSIGGNAIVAFAGFAAGNAPGWTVTGSILFQAGDAVVASTAVEAVIARPAPANLRIDVTAAVTPTELETTLGGIGVIQRRTGAETGVACQLVATASGTPEALRIFDLDGGGTLDEALHDVSVGTQYTITLARDVDDYACTVMPAPAIIGATSAGVPANQELGVRTRNAGARYAWVLAVSRP